MLVRVVASLVGTAACSTMKNTVAIIRAPENRPGILRRCSGVRGLERSRAGPAPPAPALLPPPEAGRRSRSVCTRRRRAARLRCFSLAAFLSIFACSRRICLFMPPSIAARAAATRRPGSPGARRRGLGPARTPGRRPPRRERVLRSRRRDDRPPAARHRRAFRHPHLRLRSRRGRRPPGALRAPFPVRRCATPSRPTPTARCSDTWPAGMSAPRSSPGASSSARSVPA